MSQKKSKLSLAAQDCLIGNEKRDAFAAQFNVLKRFWEAITPDPFLNPYQFHREQELFEKAYGYIHEHY